MAVVHITSENYEALVVKSPMPVLLDFWATWCGPCRMVAPIVEEIAAECDDILVGKVDVDQEMDLANRFGIVSIPTLVVMKDGQVVNQAVGYRPKADILALLGK